jgi:putrescine transport system substrate-binding protein
MHNNNKRHATWLGTLLAVGLMTAPVLTTSALAEDKVVNVYNWADYIGSDTLANFEKETGIKVQYENFESYETLDSKILTGGTGYDVIFPDNTLAYHHIKAGLYQPLDKAKLTNLGNLDPLILQQMALSDPGNQFVVPYMWWTNGISYDVDKLKARMTNAPVDSLDLVFNPDIVAKFKDCGVMFLDSPADVMGLALKYLGKDPNSNDAGDIKAAADMLLKVRPYVTRFDSVSQINAQADGSACLVINWSGAVVQAKNRAADAKNGINIAYALPKEGANIGFDGMAIPADAPHPDAAMAFINYMLGPDVIAATTNEVAYANANRASWPLVKPELRDNAALFPDDKAKANLYPAIPRSAEGLRELNREWTRVKTGG